MYVIRKYFRSTSTLVSFLKQYYIICNVLLWCCLLNNYQVYASGAIWH